MASRSIEDCSPQMRDRIVIFEAMLEQAGLDFHRSCTRRSQEEQNALWKRGRCPLEEVNAAYVKAGLAPITEQENKRPVTWTTISKHTNGGGGSDAVDYFQLVEGRASYDLKVDADFDNLPDWQEFGKIARGCGLEWGGDWKKPDYPHVQFKEV